MLSGVEEQRWIERILASVEDPMQDGEMLPLMPPPEVQLLFVGREGKLALEEAAAFYRAVKSEAKKLGVPLGTVADFGCGWGRIIRFFIKEVPQERLLGLDVDPPVLSIAQNSNIPATFSTVPARPPTELPDNHIDVLFAFSIFSHLNEEITREWLREYERVLKPGGIAVLTTRTRSFIPFLQRMRDAGEPWVPPVFLDVDDCLKRYDRGEFVHAPIAGGPTRPDSFYGESAIPRAWAKRESPLNLVGWNDDFRDGSFQSYMVLQK